MMRFNPHQSDARAPRSRFRILLAASAMALAGHAVQAAAQEKILTVGNPVGTQSINPATSGKGRAGTFLLPAYEPLVRTRADGKIDSALATKWEVSDDSKSVVFTLREDAKFSDGEPVNAEAAKKSITYYKAAGGPFATLMSPIKSIDVLSPYRFRVNLDTPNPNIVSLFDAYHLAGDLISPKAVDDPKLLLSQSFGAGPYKLDPATTISGKTYTYVPNEHYYDRTRVKWDKLVINVMQDQNSAIQAMKAGQLKLLVSDPITGNTNAASLPPTIKMVSSPLQWVGMVLLDRGGEINPALKDVRVRQALNYAVDRKLITSALFGNFGKPTNQIQGSGFLGFDEKNAGIYPYDPEKAKRLLAEAGYPNGFEMKLGYVKDTMSTMVAQAFVGQFKKVGVNVKLGEFQNLGDMDNRNRNKEYEAVVYGSTFMIPNLMRVFMLNPDGIMNPLRYEDPKLTALMNTASEMSGEKADKAWKQVYTYVVEQGWFAPIAAIDPVWFLTSAVKPSEVGQTAMLDIALVAPAE